MASQSVGVVQFLSLASLGDNMIDFVIIGLDMMQRLVKSELI